MKKMQLILGAILVLTATPTIAETDLLQTSVDSLVAKFDESKDTVYLTVTLGRCSALFAVIQGVLKRDANKDVYIGVPERLQDVAWTLTYKKLEERGVDIDDDRQITISNDLNDEFISFVKAYSSRMEANRKASGDMWSSDSLITADLKACDWVTSAVGN